MSSYACPNQSCPRRDPIAAGAPPTCYTCGGVMIERQREAWEPTGAAWEVEPFEFIYEPPEFFESTPEQRAMRDVPPLTGPGNAADLATQVQDTLLRVLFENDAPRPLAALYISLHTRLAGERSAQLGDELNYPGYRRQRVDRCADGRWPERVTLDFAKGAIDTDVEAWFFGVSHSESGEVLWIDEIHPRIYIDRQIVPQLTITGIGRITIGES